MRNRRGTGRVTLADVAKHASVSPMTASRVLSNASSVSLEMRERVMRAVEVLGYIPDVSARALASSRTGVVYLLSTIEDIPWVEKSAGTLIKGLSGDGLRLRLLVFQGNPDEDRLLIAECLGQSPAGLIITRTPEHAGLDKLLENANCPVVTAMDMPSQPLNPSIGFRPDRVGSLAAGHLIDMGYRNIGLLIPKPDWRVLARVEGYREALTNAGLFRRELIATSEDCGSERTGAELLARLKREYPELDAVCCYNDHMALGALFEANRMGLDVPDDLGICGFGGLEALSVSEPGITTFLPNLLEVAESIAKFLVSSYKGDTAAKLAPAGDFEIIVRRSTSRRHSSSGVPAAAQ